MWTGDDGPVPAGADAVGAEYRGRLGHPSSYGLLIARSADVPGIQMTSVAALRAPGDEVMLGLTEPEYAAALHSAGSVLSKGLVIRISGRDVRVDVQGRADLRSGRGSP